jgi:hypothetical protein
MAEVKAQSREERLKAALRANLKRRKAQARGRAEDDQGDGGTAGGRGPCPPQRK